MKALVDSAPAHVSRRSPGRRSTTPLRTALLVAVTEEASAALGHPFIRLDTFPFKIGRESRAHNPLARAIVAVERRITSAPQLNDVYLVEAPGARVVYISRQHCAIDRVGTGFILLDRNSMCGTGIVRSRMPLDSAHPFVERIGAGTPTDRAILNDGDLIIVGDEDSPYVFRFDVETTTDVQVESRGR